MVELPKPTPVIIKQLSVEEVRKDKPSTDYVINLANYYKKLDVCKRLKNCEVVK